MKKIITLVVIVAIATYASVYTFQSVRANNREKAAEAAYAAKLHTHPLTTAAVLSDVNEQRIKAGLQPLSENPEITKSAQAKCADQVQNKYYEHKSPVDGKTVKDWLNANTHNWSLGNENLNKGYFVASFQVVDSWTGSPGHKNTMLDPKFTDTGIAICDSWDNQKIVVQHFAAYFPLPQVVTQPTK